MLSMSYRGSIQDPAVVNEFEALFARLTGFLSQSFDEDGQLIVADPNLATVPVGGLVPYAGGTAPSGYLLCDGAQVSRVTYKSLFDVIGTAYGTGNGTTTFNVPDLRQRFPLGKAASGTGATLGDTGGAIDHTHTGGSHTHTIPDHTHSVTGSSSTNGDHAHTVDNHTHSFSATTSTPSAAQSTPLGSLGVDPLSATGTHTHAVSGTSGGATPATDHQGDHTHTVTGTAASSGAGNTGSSSGSTGANNPPYAVVSYLIFAGV